MYFNIHLNSCDVLQTHSSPPNEYSVLWRTVVWQAEVMFSGGRRWEITVHRKNWEKINTPKPKVYGLLLCSLSLSPLQLTLLDKSITLAMGMFLLRLKKKSNEKQARKVYVPSSLEDNCPPVLKSDAGQIKHPHSTKEMASQTEEAMNLSAMNVRVSPCVPWRLRWL